MPYKPVPGIYKIVNTVNNKFYIGSAVSIPERFRQHRRLLSQNKHFNTHLQAAWNKYGADAFSFEILETTSRDFLLDIEQHWIKFYSTNNPSIGYNKRLEVSSNLGIKLSGETRRKLSIAHLGHKRTPETQKKISEKLFKEVCQIDFEGQIIATYSSFKEAANLTGVYRTSISMCVNGKLKSTGGYYWCLASKVKDFVLPDPKHKKYHRKIKPQDG